MELFEAAKKAADAATSGDGGSEESRCLDALEQLKNFPVTYQLLVSTQVFILHAFPCFSLFQFIYLLLFHFYNFQFVIANRN